MRQARLLAQQQVRQAAALRGLETQTAQDTALLATLLHARDQDAAKLAQADATLRHLLPVMQRLATAPATTLLVSPLSPQESVHGIAILQGFATELAQQARMVKTESAKLASAITQAQSARQRLIAAVTMQQQAETQLATAIRQARQDEQQDINEEAAEDAAAAQARHELTSLDAAIARLAPKAPPHMAMQPLPAGGAGAPVAGHILIAYGAPTPAGPASGITYATASGAQVVSPCAGTILYAGTLTDYGQVVIGDCGGGLTTVLAGLSHLDVSQGQRVLHGQPLGSMQGFNPLNPAAQPSLFVQLRRNGIPIDPTSWLAAARHSG